MPQKLCSRERMLVAIDHEPVDDVPCSFMLFHALRDQCKDQYEFVDRQLALGLDAVMPLPVLHPCEPRETSEHREMYGLPVRFDPAVEIENAVEERPGEPYPIIRRTYKTPAGALHTSVIKTDDWVQGDRVPLLDDYVVPRARKRLIETIQDLAPLEYLLTAPTGEDVRALREEARRVRTFAETRGVLVSSMWGGLADVACWLAGMTEIVIAAIERPEFVEALFGVIGRWNHARMLVVLDEGVDLYVKRAWYEGVDLWSPALYRRCILPWLKKDVAVAHQAGAKFGLIATSGVMPLLGMYVEAGVDVLIGVDPVQGLGTDLVAMKRQVGGKLALWGGVNGFVTVEEGTEEQVREAVRTAIETLAPGGGFILSPVDNVCKDYADVEANLRALIDTWKALRNGNGA